MTAATDARSAMLEIALRAVGQLLEREDYAQAGEVVRQALNAPVDAQANTLLVAGKHRQSDNDEGEQ